MKTAALPRGFPVGRLNLSTILSKGISGRATGYTPTLPPMISPFGGQAPDRKPGSTFAGDVKSIQSRTKGTLGQLVASKTKPEDTRNNRTPDVHQGEILPDAAGPQVEKGTGIVRDAQPESAQKAASYARALLKSALMVPRERPKPLQV